MADEYDDIERLKIWWKEYGIKILIGIITGFGLLIGWNSWEAHTSNQQQQASTRYEQIIGESQSDNHPQVIAQASALIEEFTDSGYALMAALFAAQSATAIGDYDGAVARLRWAVDHTPYPEIATIANLRIARILRHQNQLDEALSVLDAETGQLMAGPRDELRGDIYLAMGDRNEARAAYEDALEADDVAGLFRQRNQAKLDALGLAAEGK